MLFLTNKTDKRSFKRLGLEECSLLLLRVLKKIFFYNWSFTYNVNSYVKGSWWVGEWDRLRIKKMLMVVDVGREGWLKKKIKWWRLLMVGLEGGLKKKNADGSWWWEGRKYYQNRNVDFGRSSFEKKNSRSVVTLLNIRSLYTFVISWEHDSTSP